MVSKGRGTGRRGRPPKSSNVPVMGKSARGRNTRNTSGNSALDSYAYGGASSTRNSRQERAKLRSLRRGAWSEEGEDQDVSHSK